MADKPFPWMCGECGRIEVRPKVIDYKAEIKHDGKLYKLNVENLEVPTCNHCGEQWFDIATDEKIQFALRDKIGLMHPEEIKSERKRLELNQEQIAEYLGVAKESISRWENGAQIQSRSTDKLLRIFFRFGEVRNWLAGNEEQELPDLPFSRDAAIASSPIPSRMKDFFGLSHDHRMLSENCLESWLVGSMLLNPSRIGQVTGLVDAEDFEGELTRDLFEKIISCSQNQKANDTASLIKGLQTTGMTKPKLYFLSATFSSIPSGERIIEFAQMVRNKSMFRRLACETPSASE